MSNTNNTLTDAQKQELIAAQKSDAIIVDMSDNRRLAIAQMQLTPKQLGEMADSAFINALRGKLNASIKAAKNDYATYAMRGQSEVAAALVPAIKASEELLTVLK